MTKETDELIERLRHLGKEGATAGVVTIWGQAADLITAHQAEIERLRAELKIIADQMTTEEMACHSYEGDFEEGFDQIIGVARVALCLPGDAPVFATIIQKEPT